MNAYAHAHGKAASFEAEHRKIHRDGSVRWFLTRGSAVRLADGRAIRIIGTDTDITERKSAEITLEETRHELARVSRVTTLRLWAESNDDIGATFFFTVPVARPFDSELAHGLPHGHSIH